MKVFDDVSSIDPTLAGAVLTVGNFDGVHLGHQRILRTARALAKVSGVAVIAMTFEPHPIAVLRPEQAPARLTLWEEKVAQLEKAGADVVVRLKTDWPLLSLPAEDFIREVLVKRIHPSYIVEGPNFGFGRGRQGNANTLRQLSEVGGYQVHIVEPYRLNISDEQITVSSTAVRSCLECGEVAKAAACLGRPYALIGSVVPGAGAGRKLGYPTINLDVGEQLIPAEGVYAGVAEVSGICATAAISVGHRPTLGGASLVVEAFLIDESDDWYGQDVRLGFLDFVRSQKKFESREALSDQITKDIETVRRIAGSRV